MSSSLRRRIVITGIGVIAPNGLTLDSFWDSLVRGTPTAGPVTRFDAGAMHSKLACEIKGFDPTLFVEPSKARRFDRSILYAVAAAKNAVADAGLDLGREDMDRFGVVEGTSVSGLENTLREHTKFVEQGYKSISPTRLVNASCGGAASEVSIELGLECQATTITTACSAGNDALGYAARTIRDDLADIMVAGACEAPIVDGYYAIFSAAGVMSRNNLDPANAMRPFDRDRDGLVLGEGAGFLILEELSHALARGARIYCEWLGHGQSADAHHLVSIHPEGKGLRRAMERAFLDAGIPTDTVDYINAHGSATEQNDVIETKVIREVFGSHAGRLSVSGTKATTGHLMGASAGLESAIAALSIHRGMIPPTAGLVHPGEGCDLDYVAGEARPYPVRVAGSSNAGFGGKNSFILLGRFGGS
jgi:3-oxoacyl-[acyl-carrier-protein] synthase II